MSIQIPLKSQVEVRQAGIPGNMQRIDTPAAMFGGGQGALAMGDALAKLGATGGKIVTNELEEQNAARTLELDNMARREANDRLYNPDTGILSMKGGNALGATAAAEKVAEEIRLKYGDMPGESDMVRNNMKKSLASIQNSLYDTAQRHQFGELQSYKDEQLVSRLTMNAETAALNFNDDDKFKKIFEDSETTLRARAAQKGWSTEKLNVEIQSEYSKVQSARLVAMIDQDRPDAIIKAKQLFDEGNTAGRFTFDDARKLDRMFDSVYGKALAQDAYGKIGTPKVGTSKAAISFVIDRLEGGDKVVNEPGGGVAKFGISSDVNTDKNSIVRRSGLTAEQVKNLSRADAEKIYQEQYWNAIDADNLPPAMRFLAFDTAVNHGVGKATELLKKAGDDPQRLIQLRYQEYQRLARSNPEKYGAQLKGWTNRLATLADNVSTGPDSKAVEDEAGRLEVIAPGAGAELLAIHKTIIDRQESVRKATQTEFLDTVMPKLYQSNGNISVLSASEKAKAVELGVWEKVAGYNGVSRSDVATKMAGMSVEEILSTDFSDPAYRLALSQSDYDEMIKRQASLRDKPAARGEFRTKQELVKGAWQTAGLSTDSGEFANFRAAVEDAFSSQVEANGGKPLRNDEMQAIASRMAMKTSVGASWFDGSAPKRVYQIDPENMDYEIAGVQSNVATRIIDSLVANNLPVNTDNLQMFQEDPSKFIQVPGYSPAQIKLAAQMLMRQNIPVTSRNVKDLISIKQARAGQ
jgi:hypothetical protein